MFGDSQLKRARYYLAVRGQPLGGNDGKSGVDFERQTSTKNVNSRAMLALLKADVGMEIPPTALEPLF